MTVAEPTDEVLMTDVARGDRIAFDRLARRHLPRVYRIARAALPGRAEAEDTAQDVFARVWIYAPRWRAGDAKFTTWLYRVTINCCHDTARKNKAGRMMEIGDDLPDTTDTEGRYAATEADRHIAAAVRALPERQRLAIQLCYLDDLPTREAADAMGLKLKALEGLLVRARRTLREKLDKKENLNDRR